MRLFEYPEAKRALRALDIAIVSRTRESPEQSLELLHGLTTMTLLSPVLPTATYCISNAFLEADPHMVREVALIWEGIQS